MEAMGLILGEFVDDYTAHVVEVFAMPQVEAVDHVFQTNMTCSSKLAGFASSFFLFFDCLIIYSLQLVGPSLLRLLVNVLVCFRLEYFLSN